MDFVELEIVLTEIFFVIKNVTQNVHQINRNFFDADSDNTLADNSDPLMESESHRELEMVGMNGLWEVTLDFP